MDSSKSFNSYSKAHELEERNYRRAASKRLIIITISAIVLVALIVCIAVDAFVLSNGGKSKAILATSSAFSIGTMCNVTRYPNSCISSIESSKNFSSIAGEPTLQDVFRLSLQVALDELGKFSSLPNGIMGGNGNDDFGNDNNRLHVALQDCYFFIKDAIGHVEECMTFTQENQDGDMLDNISNMRTWLSAAITDQSSCLNGVEEAGNGNQSILGTMRKAMQNSTEYTSNSLAIMSNLLSVLANLKIPTQRKLKWEKKLAEEPNRKPHFVVAKDGSGDFRTINQVLGLIPRRSEDRTVIYVKEGVYVENVNLSSDCWNVMMYGDGMFKTIVSGSKNYVDGSTTFSSATFSVAGKGFIAKDIGFKNTAGPQKFQAVALCNGADRSIFYQCYFDGYQDTLLTFTGRQLYRDCLITGTIDFIFGNAAAVFQNCTIQPRQPLPNQFNVITAQGKTDPNQNAGIVIQDCRISPAENLTAQTYLGRPWQAYSTTVYMHSNIDGINPMGWAQWVHNLDPPNTIFYAEYENTGPGAVLSERVKWPGYRPNITAEQANQFTVDSFIQGNGWLPKDITM